MTPSSLAYASLLKRTPSQARSVQRVEAILDTAAELLRKQEPEEITTRELATAAGVPTGTLYQFFADRDTVMRALALRYLASMPDTLDAPLSQAADWPSTIDGVVDAYAAMFRKHPAIRRLWLSGVLDSATREVERATDARIAMRLGAKLQQLAQSTRGSAVQWQSLVALIDGLLRHVFAETDSGDDQALIEAKRAARAYVAVIFGDD